MRWCAMWEGPSARLVQAGRHNTERVCRSKLTGKGPLPRTAFATPFRKRHGGGPRRTECRYGNRWTNRMTEPEGSWRSGTPGESVVKIPAS
jgi:hypothetical protein